MQSGSYAYLIERQKPILEKWGYDVKVVLDVFHNQKLSGDSIIIYYTTFSNIPIFYALFKNFKRVILYSDSALITSPFLTINNILKQTNWKLVTPSRWNLNMAKKFIDEPIEYHMHFIPDLLQTHGGRIKDYNERTLDFLTVGINEKDFDRKGHFYNFIAERIGFKTRRVCANAFCYGSKQVSEEELMRLYSSTKWYLSMSHSESPHLPVLEAFSFGTPAILLDAHEFQYFPGVKVNVTYKSVKGLRNFYFFEVDSEDFINKIAMARDPTLWEKLSKESREFFEKNVKMENRENEFREIIERW